MGYNPAGNTTNTATLTHLISVWYNRTALDQLRQMFVFNSLCEPDVLPKRSGKTVQWYRHGLLGPNTTPHAEGTVGTSLQLSTSTVQATVSEYADFISVSTLLQETAIDPVVDNASEQLGYRGGLSVDTITRTEFDATTSTESDTIGATFTVSDIRAGVSKLKGLNVKPKTDGKFRMVIHPYLSYDLMADNTAGGFIEVMKYADPGRLLSGEVGQIAQTRIMESTNVKTSGTAPDVLYYSYLVGKGAVGAVDLSGSGPAKVSDPDKQSFNVNVIKGGPSQADPEGMIGAYVSYRYVYVAKDLDATTPRHRKVKANASLV